MNLIWLTILALAIILILPLGCSSPPSRTTAALPTTTASAATTTVSATIATTGAAEMSGFPAPTLIPISTPTPTPTPTTNTPTLKSAVNIDLPAPRLESDVSLEETLLQRRSVRAYADSPLKIEEISQLLWATQGITADWGGRTAPSAGGTYPLEVYLSAGDTEGLESGIYKYKPDGRKLIKIREGDLRTELAAAALDQEWVKEAPVTIVISAVYERTTARYGERGLRYVHMEAGHAAQNTCLEATALDLGALTIGAFHDDRVKSVLRMPANEEPLYVIPVGRLMP